MSQQSKVDVDVTPSIRLPKLSPTAATFLSRYPAQARMAMVAALEAAAVHFEEPAAEGKEPPEALRPFLTTRSIDVDQAGILNVEETSRRLNVARQTVYDWIRDRRLIGWQLTRRGMQIPAEQILGPGELVAGLDRILELIPNPRAAWRFLSEESPHFDEPHRPIEMLKAGKLEAVLAAASAWGEAFT